ncbi:MAG: hypothetical protein H6774_03855 [Pseudomonadales bacterium]|nr:hypothetical protein [Pseudomonadales bacterium]
MYFALGDWQLYAYGLFFLFAIGISWFTPGFLITSKIKHLSAPYRVLLAWSMGLVVWGFQGFLFGYLGMRWLTLVYLVVVVVLCFLKRHSLWRVLKQAVVQLRVVPKWFWLIVVFSAGLQVWSVIGSGRVNQMGMLFFGVNSVDGVMHLAYIETLTRLFPPIEPGAMDIPIQNYHYWSDLMMADLVRVWRLPTLHLFFQYMPLLLGWLTASTLGAFVYKISKSWLAAALSIFFLTLGSDLSYLVSFLHNGTFGWEVSTIDAGVTHFLNMPQVFARFVLLQSFFWLLLSWQYKKMWYTMMYMLLISSLFGIKIYHGLYAVIGTGSILCFGILSHLARYKDIKATTREYHRWIVAGILGALVALAIYLPVNKAAGGLVWVPLEWPKQFMSATNFDFREWWLKKQVFEVAGNLRRVWVLNLQAFGVTLLAVFGTRLIGFVSPRKTAQTLGSMFVLWNAVPTAMFLFLGLNTMQTSGGLNTFNFFIVPIIFLTITAGLLITQLITAKRTSLTLLAGIILLATLPRSLYFLREYASRYQTHQVDNLIRPEELAAGAFIQATTQPTSVIYVDASFSYNEQTPYVSFITKRQTVLGGDGLLESHAQDISGLQALQKSIEDKRDAKKLHALLQQNNITHLYLDPTSELSKRVLQDLNNVYFAPLLENAKVRIVAVK